jgi:6-phosphogluconolactonase (cycloisomerase 2 family)
MDPYWWWGTYPEAGMGTPPGAGEGIWRMIPGSFSAELVLKLPAPSFVATHPDLPLLYAVTERDDSTVVCVDIRDSSAPVVLDDIPSGGSGACHVLLARDTLTLYVSHYATGELSVIPLAADGRLAVSRPTQVLTGSGSGPVPRRQQGPHAHFSGYSPDGSVLLVADLGTDELRRYPIAADGSLRADDVAVRLPAGSGPRHFATRGSFLYLVCELDHTLKTLHWDAASGTATVEHEAPTTLVSLRSGNAVYDAHVTVVSEVVLVSVRGSDVISVFDLGGDGMPVYRGAFDSGGAFPRYFAAVGERLIVGNEKSHQVSVFDLADVLSLTPGDDPTIPAELPHTSTRVLSPACVCLA